MLRIASTFAFALVTLSGLAGPAWAQDETTKVFFTPRLWYSVVSTSEIPKNGASVEHTTIPLYGASIAVVPANMGGTTFSLTGFYGTGNGDYQEGDASGSLFSGNNNLKRLDVEGVAQFPLGTAGAYWSLGLRFIKTDTESAGTDLFNRAFRFTTHGKYYLGEVGLGASTALNATGSHRLFGGLTLLAGQRNEDRNDVCCVTFSESKSSRDGMAGVDTNFGYSASLGGQATFYARYRLFILSELDRFASPDGLTIVHGPEINLSFKLN